MRWLSNVSVLEWRFDHGLPVTRLPVATDHDLQVIVFFVPKAIPQTRGRGTLRRILDSTALRTWLVDFMHGAQQVWRLCRQARQGSKNPASVTWQGEGNASLE